MLESHLTLWLKWRYQPSVRETMPAFHDTAQTLAARLMSSRTELSLDVNHQGEYRWVICSKEGVVGTASIRGIDWARGAAEIGYMLGDDVHGRGLGTATVLELVRLGFSDARIATLWAKTAAVNIPSQRVLIRAGFSESEVVPGAYVIQGKAVDQYQYVLRREAAKSS